MDSIHLINTLELEAGGPSVSVKRLIESLVARGENATVVTYEHGGEVSGAARQVFQAQFLPKKIGISIPLLQFLAEQKRSGTQKAIHVHNMWMFNAIYPGMLGLKFVQSPRGCLTEFSMESGSVFKPIYWRLLQKKMFAKASCFHVTSEAEIIDLRRHGFNQPVALVPHGVDVPKAFEKRMVDAGGTLMYLGRIHAEKGLGDLLHAWANVHLDFPKWRLVLVGPETDRTGQKLRDEIGQNSISGVVFHGPAYGEEKEALLRSADLLVLPSPTENFGMAIAEALAFQVPVIANRGSPWRQLETRRSGWWIDRGAESLEAALRTAMSISKTDRLAMGIKGRRWMEADFSWAAAARQMESLYSWIWGGGGLPSCVVKD